MKVAIWDSNFAHVPCSTAYQIPKHIEYIRDVKEFDGVMLFTDAWITNPIVDEAKAKWKIAWLHETSCLHPNEYKAVLEPDVYNKFDKILTYRNDLSNHPSDKFKWCCYGGTWLSESDWGLHQKSKLISMLYGSKQSTYGHQLRHLIGEMIPETKIDYFGFKGQKTDYSQKTKLRVLSPYMFSICIETCRDDWLFTEILIDAFMCGTIPIFWGCPDIGRFFDERGILAFETLPELETILDEICPEMYASMLPYANENLERAREYSCTEDWMFQHIFRELQT